jgi:alpha-1,2-mannosyltransferase
VLLGLAAAAVVATNIVNALRKGGDFLVYLEAGRRVVAGAPLYEGSSPGAGVIGPPFQALVFAPFALLAETSVVLARLAWFGLNLVLLVLAIRWWCAACRPALADAPERPLRPLVLSLLAVAFPLQTNFEHQNLNVVLLALAGGAALAASRGRDTTAGLLAGLAAALKVFPALLVGYFVVRRLWRAAAAAILATVAFSLSPALRYGWPAFLDSVRDWAAVSGQGGWPIRGNNQSLFAMAGRYLGPEGLLATGPLGRESHPAIYAAWLLGALALALATAVLLARPVSSDRRPVAAGLAASLLLAILLSPIAWDHYWVLAWPAFLLAADPPPGSPRWVLPVFWVAALLVSGLSRVTVGAAGLDLARAVSVFTWAALLLLAATLAIHRRLARTSP